MKTNSSALIVPPAATHSAATNALTGDIRDIKAPVEIPGGWFWLCCLLTALGVAALSCFAWRHWQKRRARPAAPFAA